MILGQLMQDVVNYGTGYKVKELKRPAAGKTGTTNDAKDVWFVGHCIVSPVTVEDRAMALVGSVVTKDMKENHIYGGSPAKDLTEKIKPQFRPVTLEEKWSLVKSLDVPDFVEFVDSYDLEMDEKKTYFNISDRTYTKRMTEGEQDFMKYLLGKLIKLLKTSGIQKL